MLPPALQIRHSVSLHFSVGFLIWLLIFWISFVPGFSMILTFIPIPEILSSMFLFNILFGVAGTMRYDSCFPSFLNHSCSESLCLSFALMAFQSLPLYRGLSPFLTESLIFFCWFFHKKFKLSFIWSQQWSSPVVLAQIRLKSCLIYCLSTASHNWANLMQLAWSSARITNIYTPHI